MANRAFLVGINQYKNPKANLRGCVNDMESLATLLVSKYGFDEPDIRARMLLNEAATAAAITTGLHNLLQGSQAGDVLVFAFGGHGTQIVTTDQQGEPDAKDEALVPYDLSRETLIKDDDIYTIITSYIPEEAPPDTVPNLTAIYDSCHSGTMIRDLIFDPESGNWEEDVVNRYVDFDEEFLRGLGGLAWSSIYLREVKLGPYNVLSACQDEETAADLRKSGELGVPRGAFSFALHKELTDNPNRPLQDLEAPVLEGIRAVSKHKQNPSYYGVAPEAPLFSVP